jgi:hypothetical protein
MKTSHINYVHLFIEEKEYLLEQSLIAYVNDIINSITIAFRILNDQAINVLIDFFEANSENILMFLCYNFEKTDLLDDIVSYTVNYDKFEIDKGLCKITFKKVVTNGND